MGAITIRNLADDVIAGIKARAKRHGRSMEEEARLILAAAAAPPLSPAMVECLRRALREDFGGRVLPDSGPLLRGLREGGDAP